MIRDIKEILLDETAIRKRISELGAEISADYQGKTPVLIAVLKGSVVFLADMMRAITIPVETDFLSVSSYGDSTVTSGVVRLRKDLDSDISGRDIIVVEDIVDSGLSLKYLLEFLHRHNPASVKLCVLLDKPAAHKTEVSIDYLGFPIGNEFVVGYGLDYAEKYRNLPYIGVLKEEVYK